SPSAMRCTERIRRLRRDFFGQQVFLGYRLLAISGHTLCVIWPFGRHLQAPPASLIVIKTSSILRLLDSSIQQAGGVFRHDVARYVFSEAMHRRGLRVAPPSATACSRSFGAFRSCEKRRRRDSPS